MRTPARSFTRPAGVALFSVGAVFAGALLAMPGLSQTSGRDRMKALAVESLSTISGEARIRGLRAPVEVVRDEWGVPHIYAQNLDDLFMAQGYVMAQDRLWQMDMWRREREGRLAEVLGPQAVARDRQARLYKYRGPMDDREWTSYHPDGKRIFIAYAAGVNAFIAERAGNLPVEFKLTGLKPEPWTAETVVLRTATLGNGSSELQLAREVARLGVAEANRQSNPDPWDDLQVPEGLEVAVVAEAPTGRGGGGRGGRGGSQPEIVEPYRSWIGSADQLLGGLKPAPPYGLNARSVPPVGLKVRSVPSVGWNVRSVPPVGLNAWSVPSVGLNVRSVPSVEAVEPGSNNWVVNGKLSATGKPVVVNDPHRSVGNPSLRYIVHLNAPGWNVIGAGEVPFVGVAIGHNDRLGWGLTIVGTDQEDVYVEELNPANPNEVRWRGGWEPLRVVREEIKVKGEAPQTVELKFSRHGPIFAEDPARHRVYALRSALLEPGTAPYLGGLRLAQAVNCKEFLSAAMYWKSPSENLICGDVDGNISWQASALTPNRKGWSGRLPVPGTGSLEWDGFRPDLPREFNPARGYIATANHNIHPPGYRPPIMFKSSVGLEFERITRVRQMLQAAKSFTLDDHRRMQHDALSLRAVSELPLFRGWTSAHPEVERARRLVAEWDGVFAKDSAAAAIYSTWRSGASAQERDATRPADARKPLLETGLTRAIDQLKSSQGADAAAWRWGRMHTSRFPHPLVAFFDLPLIERSGGAGTVAADGATYREILDVADWDRSLVTNVPGQSGQPESPFYGNLRPLFENETYFPLLFSKGRVEKSAKYKLVLRP
jgi:penicillin amidase